MIRTRSGQVYPPYNSKTDDYNEKEKMIEEYVEAREKFLSYEDAISLKVSYLDFMNKLCIFKNILWERLYSGVVEVKCSETGCINRVTNTAKVSTKSEDNSAYIVDTYSEMKLICRTCYDKKIKSGDIYIPKKIERNPAIKTNKQSEKRIKILPKTKDDIWISIFDNNPKGKCKICRMYIKKTDCDIGHNVPHHVCNDYTELIPICKKCNSSIGYYYSINFMAEIVSEFTNQLRIYGIM
jgi:hypothetical protein